MNWGRLSERLARDIIVATVRTLGRRYLAQKRQKGKTMVDLEYRSFATHRLIERKPNQDDAPATGSTVQLHGDNYIVRRKLTDDEHRNVVVLVEKIT